jgi:hypothetical protein
MTRESAGPCLSKPTRRRASAGEGRGGFVLAFVVFMLFAISVAGVTGYIIVSSEFTMAKYSGQGAEALTVARAGLERFVAEQIGVVGDSVSYALGDGVAFVTARKVAERDSLTEMYYIRSEGTVDDIFSPNTPARRVVGGYAIRHRRPLAHHAVVMIAADRIDVDNGGEIDGFDKSDAGDCPGGGATAITGAIATTTVTEDSPGDLQGNPEYEIWSGGWSEMLDSIGLRWDVLSDPNFPVDYENTLPNFSSLPADSFPIIRYTGWVFAGWTGRGLLIVDGVFDPNSSFRWEGIILAKHVDDIVQGHIDGMLVGGLEGPNMYSTINFRTEAAYESCSVYSANETLSYLELLPNTIFEAN